MTMLKDGRAYLDGDTIVPTVEGATTLTNSFEGGTDGTTITTGNSGGASGNAFDGVNFDNTGTPGVVAYSNVQKKAGSLSARIRCGSVAAITGFQWSTSRGTLTDDFVRAYFYLTNAMTFNEVIVRWFSGALADVGRIRWLASNNIDIIDNAGTQMAQSTNTMSLNQWVRLEAQHHCSTTATFITVKLFTGANVDGVTPDDTFGTANTFTGPSATSGRVDMGIPQAQGADPSSSGFLYVDDAAAGGATWWGPSTTRPSPWADVRMGG